MKFHINPLYRHARKVLGTAFLFITSTTLFGQVYGPLNVRAVVGEYGVAVDWDFPEGYDPRNADPAIWKIFYKRDGGDPVWHGTAKIDAPLEPATTYSYEIYGEDSQGILLTEPVTMEVTTLPAGHGLTTSRVSLTTTGDERKYDGLDPMISGDGRYVAYASYDWQENENSGQVQILRHDRETGTTIVVSRNADGDYADRKCELASVSADGRFIAFVSEARNLSPEDTDSFKDVYLYDAETDTVTLVSDAPGVGSSNGFTMASVRVSGDGSTVVFISDARNLHADATDGSYRGYLYNTLTTDLVLIPEPDHSIFQWDPGDPTGLALSGDGSLIVLTYNYRHTKGFAGNLQILWQFDRTVGENGEISALTRNVYNPNLPAASITGAPTVSSDGRFVAFAWTGTRDSNDQILDPQSDYAKSIAYSDGYKAGFVLDRQTDTLEVFTLTPWGTATGDLTAGVQISISDDGRFIAYTGPNSTGRQSVIYSPDGIGGVIVHDRALKRNTLVSRSTSGDFTETGYQKSGSRASISADGAVAAYRAGSSNLVPGDTNNVSDVFVTELDLAPPDLNTPTWPNGAGLEATNTGATLVDLAWTVAEDAEGPIAGYRVFGDGEIIANTGPSDRMLQVPGLEPETTYLFKVEALDGSGNISTDGPELEVTTKALSSGNATLSAPALDGGNVDLAWDPTEESVLGYVIERRTGGGDWEQAAEVGPAVTTYLDGGLPADTTVAYRILKKPSSGDPLVHSQTVEVTTKTLSIASVSAGLPFAANSRSILTIGGEVDLRMTAEAGRIGRADLTVETWNDTADPSQGTSNQVIPVDLAELPGTPGLYTAAWTLPDGTANLVSISGMLTDGFGASTSSLADGFPMPIEAKFSINVDGDAADYARGLVFTLWSETNRAGCSRSISGSTAIEKGGLPPGDDYRLRVIQGNRVVKDLTAVTLQAGLVTTIDESIEPATAARFLLKDPDGEPRGGFLIGTYDSATDRFIGWGTVAEDGTVDAAPGVLFAPGSEIVYRLQNEPWDIEDGPLTATIPAFNTTGTLNLEWGPYFVRPGTLSGTTVGSDNDPIAAKITVVSGNEGVQQVSRADTSEDGTFSVDPIYATASLLATSSRYDPDSGKRINLAGRGTFEIPEIGGNVDAGDIVLEPVLPYSFIVRSLELLQPDGTTDQIRPGSDPRADHIGMRIIRPGFLRSDARSSGSKDGLRLEVEYPPGTDYILTIDAAAIGYGISEITGTTSFDEADADGTVRIEIDSVLLAVASDAWVTGSLENGNGQPIDPNEAWSASTIRDDRFDRRRYHGYGPDLLLPTAIGSGQLKVSLLADPNQIIVKPLTAAEGANDLGDLSFSSTGRFKSSKALSLSTGPRLLGSGQHVNASLRILNTQNTAVEGGTASILVPPGLEPVNGTLLVDNTSVTGVFADDALTIQIGKIEPGDATRIYVEFALTETFEGSSISLSATFGYTAPEGTVEEQVGSRIIEVVARPTITGPTSVAGPTILLRGRSPRGALQIYDGDTPIGARRVSSQGYWYEKVTLADRRVPYWHTLTARLTTASGEVIVSEPFEVLHQPGGVRPTRVRMRQPPTLKDPQAVHLLQRFPDVVEWTEWEVGPEVPRFWRRILAGFPFEFALEMNQPELVEDLAITVAGPGGGTAMATQGEDGLFRATIETDRDGWSTGPISVSYEDKAAGFPKWGNELEIGEITELPEAEPEPGDAVSVASAAPLQYDGRDAYVQGGSFSSNRRGLDATITYKVWPDVVLTNSDTATITYPGGTLTYPAETVPFRQASFDYSVSGRDFRFSVTVYTDYARYLAQDRGPPSWDEDAVIAVSEPSETSVLLTWPRAQDELWIQEYVLTVDGNELARIPGGRRSHRLTERVDGNAYEISLVPIDGAEKAGPPLELSLDFKGSESKAISMPPVAAQEDPNPFGLAWEEAMRTSRPVAAAGGTEVATAIDVVGKAAVPIDILSLLSDYFDAYDQANRWNDMIETMDACGVSPALKEKVNNEISDAAAALAAKTTIGTGITVASVGATATGAAAPVGAALAVGGLVSGYVLGEIAEGAATEAETAFEEAMNSRDECEDPKNPRKPRRRSGSSTTIADPVWKIDPSGFVYEVTEENRLEGVTAILLEGESENGPWEISDAAAFGEINPQVTPVGGTYRWDVPAGWWQVMYQKEGYETTYSDVLEVPPPHFDVNIPLKSLAAPEVLLAGSLNNGAAVEITFANFIRAAMASPETVRVRTAGGILVPGQITAPAEWLVDNPHTESTAKDITTRILFVPDSRLTIGETYTVEVDGVIESYGEIPMGETAQIEITIQDSFTGTWFGTFDPGGGLWTATVGEDRSIALEGFDPKTGTRFQVDGTVGEDGTIKLNMEDLNASAVFDATLSDGTLAGTVSVLDYTVVGTRSLGSAAATEGGLTYHGAVIGSKTTTVTAHVGMGGTVLAIIDGDLATTAVTANLDNEDRFSGFLSDGSELELDLSDPDGTMSGVLSLVSSGSWEVLGAAEGTPPGRLVNVSGRGPVLSGAGSLIAGFVTRGSVESPMLIRAIGPGLKDFGLTGVLEQPRIRLVDQTKPADTSLVDQNTDWLEAGDRNELRAVFAGLGAFFLQDGARDATVYLPVQPGPYTAVVEGVDGDVGIALVEAYDADLGVFGTTSEGVANLSLRGNVGSGSAVMIAGFVITGQAPRQLLIRGIGPGLGPLGVQGFLEDPEITLYRGEDPIADNQTWSTFLPDDGLADLFPLVGAFDLASDSDDAALVIWLAPGAYTVHLGNEVAGEGVGLIELYDMP